METTARLRYRLPPSPHPDLDFLLGQVAEAVQLTPTQYEKAATAYTAVGDWLAAPESPLAVFKPRMYAQGSMRLGTTVRPRGRVEHDLDAVCQVAGGNWTAMALYDAVRDRLFAHKTYRTMLKEKNRCVCLEYAGDFHLDIIPAVAAPQHGATSILVPDCKLEDWTSSNPKGYAVWFEQRSVALLMEKLAKAMAEPLPPHRDADEKLPLAVAVQLIKRARDVMFDGADVAPRSIILTTLAGNCYTGGTSLIATLIEILRGIVQRIDAAAPAKIELFNPSNPAENFSDALTDERYRALREFASTVGARVSTLLQLRGIERLQVELEKLFDSRGQAPVREAIRKYAEFQKAQRDSGRLTYSSSGLGIVAPAAAPVARNNYYGE